MLADVTNNMNARGQGHGYGHGHGHSRGPALKPLRIVRRTQAARTARIDTTLGCDDRERDENVPQMSDYPNYRFNKLLQREGDVLFPFYECGVKTENVYLRNREPKLDFSNDVTYFKNVTKKYKRPMVFQYICRNTKRADADADADPVSVCFQHAEQDAELPFGDYLINVKQNGSYSMQERSAVTVKGDADADIDEDEEALFHSDEGECSRLENSDTETSEEIEEEEEEDVDTFEFAEAYQPSPSSSPAKHDFLLRTLKEKSSPVKALHAHRNGTGSMEKPSKFNYAKWDNSMTISAKAIMKMVDDSLVSSDTELYNQTASFIAAKDMAGKNGATSGLKGLHISAADLLGALEDDGEEEGDDGE